MTQRIVIPLAPRTKKNHTQIIRNKYTGKTQLIQSSAYRQYEKDCGYYLKHVEPFLSACNACCVYYMPTRRKVDLNNLLSATTDILVRYGILVDDSSEYIKGFDGSRVFYDKESPRTEIILTEWEE